MSKRPNILFIMSDDHAAHALSCYNSNINTTPNLDRIAKEGARFERCFCTNNICEPSRAAILTGTYNHVNGVTTIGAHIDNKLPNVAKVLQSAGYQTAVFGKWHMGEGPAHCPTGFDTWKVLRGQGPYFDPTMDVGDSGGGTGEESFTGYTTDIITDLTLDYLKKRDKDKPFFVKYHHKAPHREWEPDDKHKDMYKDVDIPLPVTFDDNYDNRSRAAAEAEMRVTIHMRYRDLKLVPPEGCKPNGVIPHPEDLSGFSLVPIETGEPVFFKNEAELKNFKYQRYIKDYLRCVASIDDNVGRVLDYLKEEGIEDDTVVVYTSDQGFFLGDHGWYDKRFMYEESLKMPFLVKYPKMIKPGQVINDIATNVDFAPTFCEWAGIDIPEYMQGYSFVPLVSGGAPKDWQQSMYYRYWMHLSHHYVSAHYGVRTLQYKLIYYYGKALGQPETIDEDKQPEWELFDLKADPFEMNNVYHDKAYAKIREELKDELHRLQKKVGDKPEIEID